MSQLIKCKACDADMGIAAEKCMRCGTPNPIVEANKSQTVAYIIGGAAAFLLIGFALYYTSDYQQCYRSMESEKLGYLPLWKIEYIEEKCRDSAFVEKQLNKNTPKVTYNSFFMNEDEGDYGVVVGHKTQDSADSAAKKLCQNTSKSANCKKIIGDNSLCIAYALSPIGGHGAVVTANSKEQVINKAVDTCNKASKKSYIQDCVIAESSAVVCAK